MSKNRLRPNKDILLTIAVLVIVTSLIVVNVIGIILPVSRVYRNATEKAATGQLDTKTIEEALKIVGS